MSERAETQARIDTALRRAVEKGEVPGVVAMAAGDTGPLYEGAFGRRDAGSGEAMTLDTVFRIASMTKAVTSVAAMQLVEEGRLALDAPAPDIGEPALNAPQVLGGFDASGKPILRPATRPITLRHLLTHTAGFTYDWSNPNTRRYVEQTGMPVTATGKRASLRQPLAFDPGERWEYGIAIDWIGLLIEAVCGEKLDAVLRDRVFAPLGMRDTGFVTSPEQRARQARIHQKYPDGRLEPQPLPEPFVPEFWAGGGGLVSTAPDYLTFLEMLLHGGALNGAQILKPETVALMHQNHVGDLPAGVLHSIAPERANDLDLFPGEPVRWGLGYMLNLTPGPNGRGAGTVSWAGIFNSYYWLDPERRVAGVILTQMLPFADPDMLRLLGEFERGVYALAKAPLAEARYQFMALLHLLRHGTHNLGGGMLAGRMPGVGLTERGRAEIAAASERLAEENIAALYASPLQRTRESAEIVAERLGLPIEFRDDLIELDFGEWTGTTFNAIRADPRWHPWNQHRSLARIPGGETMRAVQSRAVEALLDIAGHHRDAAVVVVSHGDVIRAALVFALGMPLDFYGRIEVVQGSLSTIRIDESGIRVVSINERPRMG